MGKCFYYLIFPVLRNYWFLQKVSVLATPEKLLLLVDLVKENHVKQFQKDLDVYVEDFSKEEGLERYINKGRSLVGGDFDYVEMF